MNIRSIDIMVHPSFYQIPVPYLPPHKRQLALGKMWNQRFNEIKEQEEAILLYFSYVTDSVLNQGLKDPSAVSNKIEQQEVLTIKKVQEMLGNRIILFSWTLLPNEEKLVKTIKDRGFTYVPKETKIRAYGEVFEICVSAWSYHIANIFDIPHSNVQLDPEYSLTNTDCRKISNWRIAFLTNPT